MRSYAKISKSVIHFLLLVALILATCVAAEDDNNGNGVSQSSEDDHGEYSDASDAYHQDEWYADDPYLPTDDEFVQQIQAEIKAQQSEMIEELEHRRNEIRQILKYTAAGSIAIVGLVAAIFCTSLLLYDLGVVMLMRRYMRDGVVVDGRIIVSDPDIDDSTKIEALEHHLSANNQNSDSYSMMTDDESYQGGSKEVGVFSISGRSGIIDVEEGPSIDTKSKQPPQMTNPIGSEVSFGNGSNDQTLTVFNMYLQKLFLRRNDKYGIRDIMLS